MFKYIALALALIVALAAAQDGGFDLRGDGDWNRTFDPESNPFEGINDDGHDLSDFTRDADREFDDGRFELNVTREVNETIRRGVLDSFEYKALLLAEAATVIQLREQRGIAKAKLELAKKAWDFFKNQVLAKVTELQGDWKERLDNLTRIRNETVRDSDAAKLLQNFIKFQTEKFVAKEVAARLFKLAADGEAKELALRVINATIFFLNNTIAAKNGSIVDGEAWALVNQTLVKERLLDIQVAAKVAEWKAENRTRELFSNITKERQEAIAEFQEKLQEIKEGKEAKIEEIKSAWKATADQNVSIAERIKDFIENVTDIEVKLEGLDGSAAENITATIKIALDQAGIKTVEDAKKYLKEHIKAVLIALTGAKEDEVTTEATTATKRAMSSFAVTAQIGQQQQTGETSATAVAVSALCIFSAVLALVF